MEGFANNILAYSSNFLQALSLISAIVIAVVSVLGLKQLSIAKDSINTQSLRDAKRLSAEYVYLYLERIVGYECDVSMLSKEQLKLLKDFRYSSDDEDFLNVKEIAKLDPTKKLTNRKKRDEYIKELIEAARPYFGLLNELEAFSSVVVSGILDENAMFRAVGQNFVNHIQKRNLEHFLRFYCKNNNLYTNLFEMYDLWNTRLVVDETETKLRSLEKNISTTIKDIKNLRERVDKIETRTIEPIGVNRLKK
jgi:hypothetical protein